MLYHGEMINVLIDSDGNLLAGETALWSFRCLSGQVGVCKGGMLGRKRDTDNHRYYNTNQPIPKWKIMP